MSTLDNCRKIIEEANERMWLSNLRYCHYVNLKKILLGSDPYSLNHLDDVGKYVEAAFKAHKFSSEQTRRGKIFYEYLAEMVIEASGKFVEFVKTPFADFQFKEKKSQQVFCLEMKSGCKWANADSRKQLVSKFSKWLKLKPDGICIEGYGYYDKNDKSKNNWVIGGTHLWEFLSGYEEFDQLLWEVKNIPYNVNDTQVRLEQEFRSQGLSDGNKVNFPKLQKFIKEVRKLKK